MQGQSLVVEFECIKKRSAECADDQLVSCSLSYTDSAQDDWSYKVSMHIEGKFMSLYEESKEDAKKKGTQEASDNNTQMSSSA